MTSNQLILDELVIMFPNILGQINYSLLNNPIIQETRLKALIHGLICMETLRYYPDMTIRIFNILFPGVLFSGNALIHITHEFLLSLRQHRNNQHCTCESCQGIFKVAEFTARLLANSRYIPRKIILLSVLYQLSI